MATQGALSGQVALVSGASRGLGRATAVELAAAGAYVVCTARSTRDAATQTAVDDLTLEGTLDAIRAAGGDGELHRCDHTEPGQVEALLRDVLERHGRIDVLVNNAWGGHDHHEDVGGEEVWDEPMEQFRAMLLAGAYSDFVTTMLTLRLAMGPAGAGLVAHYHVAHPGAASVGALRVEQGGEEPARLRARLPPAGQGHPGDRGRARLDAHRADGHPPHRGGAGREDRDSPPRGRVMAALAADPDAMEFTGQVVDVGDMAERYGIDDLDGTRPHWNAGRYLPSPVPPPLPAEGS